MSLTIDWLKGRIADRPENYLDDIYRYAMARLGQREDAEDVAIEIVQALPDPCYRRDLRIYMLGMARRKIADRRRRARPTVEIGEADAAVRFDSAVNEAAMVEGVLQSVIPEHREVLVLKYVIGLSSAEIGKLLGKRADAIDSLLQRARDAFAQRWRLLSSDEVNQ